MKTKTLDPIVIRRSKEFEKLLRATLALVPEIKEYERGWFPKLLIHVFSFYVNNRGV